MSNTDKTKGAGLALERVTEAILRRWGWGMTRDELIDALTMVTTRDLAKDAATKMSRDEFLLSDNDGLLWLAAEYRRPEDRKKDGELTPDGDIWRTNEPRYPISHGEIYVRPGVAKAAEAFGWKRPDPGPIKLSGGPAGSEPFIKIVRERKS